MSLISRRQRPSPPCSNCVSRCQQCAEVKVRLRRPLPMNVAERRPNSIETMLQLTRLTLLPSPAQGSGGDQTETICTLTPHQRSSRDCELPLSSLESLERRDRSPAPSRLLRQAPPPSLRAEGGSGGHGRECGGTPLSALPHRAYPASPPRPADLPVQGRTEVSPFAHPRETSGLSLFL